jgi:hypothetical protein
MSGHDAIEAQLRRGAIKTPLAAYRHESDRIVEFVLERRCQSLGRPIAHGIGGLKEKLMKNQHKIFASIAIVLLAATASFAQQVKTDYDRSTDFSQYKTYSWEKVQTQDQLWVDRIKGAVDAALAAKGWTQVPSGGNASIVAIEMTRNQQTLDTFYSGFGGGWRWGGGLGDATTTVDTYKVGTLVVDLFDANSKKLVWRGSSSDTLSDKSDKNIKNLDKGVQKMFDHFPPGQK